jgi:hypothetical protein
MIEGLKINQAILEYKHAYEEAGLTPPPYRLTCKEHKALVEYCQPLMVETTIENGEFKKKPIKATSMIAEYYGVKIEVVIIVDAYL